MPQDLWDLSGGTYLANSPVGARSMPSSVNFQEKVPLEIKNPASSAGHSHFSLAVAPREARQFLTRARKVPHSRI